MTDPVVGIDKRQVLTRVKEIHDAASAEFDTATTVRKHECNGVMEACRDLSNFIARMDAVVPKKTGEDD